MPIEPPDPGIVQSFLDAVKAALGWSSNHLVSPNGGTENPAVVPSTTWPDVGQWTVQSTGVQLSQDTYNLLKGATAPGDGSFVSANGTRYWLASRNGWATPVAA